MNGGLAETFLFDPQQASSATDPNPVCPFGWQIEDQSGTWTNLSPRMTYDRWYPVVAQYFAPDYAESPSAEGPDFSFGNGGITIPGEEPYLRWGNDAINVVVQTDDATVDHASLIRLGSVTHGFNMDQRYLGLPTEQGDGDGSQVHVAPVAGDFHSNTAPAGYYVLFLASDEGEPGVGRYIRVGDETSPS